MTSKKTMTLSLLALPICLGNQVGWAEPANIKPAEQTIELPDMDVVGAAEKVKTLPGSGVVIDQQTLFNSHVFNVNEALRKAPGVYVRDEEGFGIRPNIGIRGMNPFRSTKISFLEDGLPLNYAPYGDNDIYYHPPIERYDSVEVMKGSEMNKYGPQTISGVLNYLTPNPAEKPGGFLSFTGGSRDYLSGHLRYGGMAKDVNVINGVGGVADYIHKEGSGSRNNTFAKIDDVNLKGILDIDAHNKLILRGDFYEEQSQSTFGLTEAEYKNFGWKYNPFKNDAFTTNRWATSATHEYRFNDDVTLSTSFYWSEFNRDFWRQMNQQPTDTQCGNAFREARLSGQAVNVDTCNFTRGRLRSYETWGVTPTLHAKYNLFGITNELDAGFRAHFENQYRKTEDGNTPAARTGKLIENNERYADAFSGFVQNRFILGNVSLTPGVRVESVSYERKNLLPGQEAS
ncbi:MAG: TonB-dependent receptor plug domain-containing protein, partial [Methylococcales bacterium]